MNNKKKKEKNIKKKKNMLNFKVLLKLFLCFVIVIVSSKKTTTSWMRPVEQLQQRYSAETSLGRKHHLSYFHNLRHKSKTRFVRQAHKVRIFH